MGLLYLEFPRLLVTLDLPDQLVADFAVNFSFAVTSRRPREVDQAYRIQLLEHGAALFKNQAPLGTFPTSLELMFSLEEDIENSLVACIGDWVGLHAGAAVLQDTAIVVVGRPDTGKTTTTFQLVELGLGLLCEEVTPIDPATGMVQPFPQVLTLARAYAEEFRSRHPVTKGTLRFPDASMARYAAKAISTRPVPLGVVLFPSFDPSGESVLEEVRPGRVLTEMLPHCFAPAAGDERLYDNVIRLIDRCRLFKLRTSGIDSARERLVELIARVR